MSRGKHEQTTKSPPKNHAGQDLMFLAWIGAFFTYSIILIFCAKDVIALEDQSFDAWAGAFVEAVCISTFTYVFTQMVNNLSSGGKHGGAFKSCILIFCLDIPYILLYGIFEHNFQLNLILCGYTGILLILTFVSVHQTVKAMQTGNNIFGLNVPSGFLEVPPESRLPQ